MILQVLFLLFMVLPQILFGASFLTPQIKNYGVYKEVANSEKKNLHDLWGHVPNDVNNAIVVAPMDESKLLELSIVLPLNNEDELDDMLLDLLSANKSEARNFLSHDEFVKKYSPTLDQVNKAKFYLRSKGFKIKSTDANRLIIHVTGTVKNINKIFNTTINHYVDHDGKEFYAPAYELQVEKGFNIQGVQGLENRLKAHSKVKSLAILNPHHDKSNALTPANIRKAYSLSNTMTGTGQVLALFELDGFKESDITAYENAYGLPYVPLQTILVDGFDGSAGEGGGEVTLDIELMIAVAPGASKILVYEGPNTGAGLVDTYNKIATDNIAKSISTSWGLSETSSTGSLIKSESAIFKQMAAQGQTLYAASGDNGAYDDGSNLGVDDPASQPLVVAVGGTTLFTNSDGSYRSERTWSSGNGPGNSGGGGGISSIWPIPDWQQGIISPSSRGSTTMRNVPDVALDADPSTGYSIYYNGGWNVFGGTSCAAPLWAAFNALVNQARLSSGQSVLGFPNAILSKLGQSSDYNSIFHDINDNSANGYYPAVTGYDLATGWGSFIGDKLLAKLSGSLSPPPTTCNHANPTVSISPVSQQALAGTALTYTLMLTNNDNTACSSSSFSLNTHIPSTFSQSLGQSVLSVLPGQSVSTTLVVTSGSASLPEAYNFSVDATSTADSSLIGSASGTYVVQDSQGQILNIMINPENGVFHYNSYRYAEFRIDLSYDSKPVANNRIDLTVEGPSSWTSQLKTGGTGRVNYGIFLNRGLPVGTYHMTLRSSYKNATVTHQTTFEVIH